MSRILYFDCFNGASGDMVLGAFLDAGLPLEELRRALGSLAIDGASSTKTVPPLTPAVMTIMAIATIMNTVTITLMRTPTSTRLRRSPITINPIAA